MTTRWRNRVLVAVALACAVLAFQSIEVAGIGQPERLPRTSEPSAPLARVKLPRPTLAVPAVLGGTVRGTDGPLHGARVCAACAGCEAIGAAASDCTHSDAQGRYSFAQLSPGPYYLHAAAAGHRPGSARDGAALVVAPGQRLDDVDIVLEPGGALLAGVVEDALGGVVPHARVRAVRLSPPQLSVDVAADDNGRFELSVSHGTVSLAVSAQGYATARRTVFAPNAAANVALTPGAAVRGVVVAAGSRQPLADMRVRMVPSSNRNAPVFLETLTDAAGQFAIEGLEPGSYAISARGARWFAQLAGSIDLGLGDQADDVELTATEETEVRGRVVHEDGRPCSRGLVGLRALAAPDWEGAPHEPERRPLLGIEQVAEVQPDGSVHFPGMQQGHYRATVRCIDGLWRDGPRTLAVRDEAVAGVTWTVAAGATLQVRVVDARRQPVAFARFALRKPLDAQGQRRFTVYRADADGHYEIPGLEPGSYELSPRGTGSQDEVIALEIAADQPRAEAVLALEASATLEVLVESSQGEPSDGVRVLARALDEGDSERMHGTRPAARPWGAVPLGGGRFRIGPMPAGAYSVRVDDGAQPLLLADADGVPVEVRDGELTTLRVTLPREAAVRGRVTDEHGAPAANVWVSCLASSAAHIGARAASAQVHGKRVLSDDEGFFELTGVEDGVPCRLRAWEPYGTAVVVDDVEPGRDLEVVLPAPGRIAGSVRDAEGAPVGHFLVRASSAPSDAVVERTIADDAGRFAFDEVPPGRVQLTVITPEGRIAHEHLELGAGGERAQLRLVVDVPELAARGAAAPSGAQRR